jgi:hypothetical protein
VQARPSHRINGNISHLRRPPPRLAAAAAADDEASAVQKAIEASLEEAGPAARRVGKPAAAPHVSAFSRFIYLLESHMN